MSRAQQGNVLDTAKGQNATYNANANTSFNATQADIANYGDAVGNFAANNPYVQGGAVQTAQNQEASDTAAGIAQAAGQTLQGAAVRTGQNPGGAIAAEQEIARNAQRTLSGEEAGNTVARAGADTGYQQAVLAGRGQQASMENTVADEEAKAAQGALGTEETAAQTPSFMDELGQGIIQTGVGFAQGAGKGLAGG